MSTEARSLATAPGRLTADTRCRTRRPRYADKKGVRSCVLTFLHCGVLGVLAAPVSAQAPATPPVVERHLTIPYLANVTKPTDLDFAAAMCDITEPGDQMTCRFRQVFITPTSLDPALCAITTSGYDQVFRRDGPAQWRSDGPPEGDCGLVETTTLVDGGTTRWTMTVRHAATRRGDTPVCLAAAAEAEVYDWKSLRRRLPCTSIQPGAIER